MSACGRVPAFASVRGSVLRSPCTSLAAVDLLLTADLLLRPSDLSAISGKQLSPGTACRATMRLLQQSGTLRPLGGWPGLGSQASGQ